MMEELLAWLQRSEGPPGYFVLGAASAMEYVFPPFPGDTVTLFGVVLAASAGYGVAWVYLALNVGALAGGMAAYGAGRWIAARRETRAPRFLRTQQVRGAIDFALVRFEKHGAIYLALNRFVPALRSVFFLAAGMARLPAWKVALWGTVSAMMWNGLLLGAGWLLGASFEQLRTWVGVWGWTAIGVTVVVVAILVWRFRRAAAAGRLDRERDGDGP